MSERDEELLGSLDEQLVKHRLAAEDEAGEFEIADDVTGEEAVDTDDPINDETVDDVTDPDAESGEQK